MTDSDSSGVELTALGAGGGEVLGAALLPALPRPHAVLHTVIAAEFVDSLLDECPAELRPRLLSLYSSMSSSIGFYFFDLEDSPSAMPYCDQAREAAQKAQNTELAIYALCNMSYFSSRQGKVHIGIDLAAAARKPRGQDR